MVSTSDLLLENTLFIIISFLLAVDNLRVCIVLGTINTISPYKKNIALVFGLSESLAILLGFLIGKASIKLLEPWSDYIGPLVIGCIGLFFILSYKMKCIEYLDYRWLLYGLPVSLSIDNIIAGVGLGIVVGFDIIIFIIITGIVACLTSMLGFKLGNSISNRLNIKSELFSGIMLVLIALSFLLFKL